MTHSYLSLKKIKNWLIILILIFHIAGMITSIYYGIKFGGDSGFSSYVFSWILYPAAVMFFLLSIFDVYVLYIIKTMNENFETIGKEWNEKDFKANINESPESILPSGPIMKGVSDAHPKYSVGQLVIITKNEEQFRINKIKNDGGVIYYWSNEFNKYYPENEIEDFDFYYWNRKKSD